ncbi:hypothetical protein CONLIGDRAFT_101559 [Coniochaeta ligniaria NRRL 30616]|uniref:Uncharacterized protein n=1 Tax=Coniochaeta ligniaria NRRL 30616 TaxID=1408157 RepID=A0A1J7IBE7_9PEZI|nr:hypothetical protein CONLIGDRAFT_101559 [Coniochaeta ligniaria NRRL 30616]
MADIVFETDGWLSIVGLQLQNRYKNIVVIWDIFAMKDITLFNGRVSEVSSVLLVLSLSKASHNDTRTTAFLLDHLFKKPSYCPTAPLVIGVCHFKRHKIPPKSRSNRARRHSRDGSQTPHLPTMTQSEDTELGWTKCTKSWFLVHAPNLNQCRSERSLSYA